MSRYESMTRDEMIAEAKRLLETADIQTLRIAATVLGVPKGRKDERTKGQKNEDQKR